MAVNDVRTTCVYTRTGFHPLPETQVAPWDVVWVSAHSKQFLRHVPTSLPMEVTDTPHLLADGATKEVNVQQSDLPELTGMEETSSIACVGPNRVIPILNGLVDKYINNLDTMATKFMEVVRKEELSVMCHVLIHHPLCLRLDKIFAAFDRNGGSQLIDDAFIEHYKLKTLTEYCCLTTIQIPIFERYIDHILACRWIGDSLLCSYIASRNSTAIAWFTKRGFYVNPVDIAGGTWEVDFRGDSVYVPGGDGQHYEMALDRAKEEIQAEFNAKT